MEGGQEGASNHLPAGCGGFKLKITSSIRGHDMAYKTFTPTKKSKTGSISLDETTLVKLKVGNLLGSGLEKRKYFISLHLRRPESKEFQDRKHNKVIQNRNTSAMMSSALLKPPTNAPRPTSSRNMAASWP